MDVITNNINTVYLRKEEKPSHMEVGSVYIECIVLDGKLTRCCPLALEFRLFSVETNVLLNINAGPLTGRFM